MTAMCVILALGPTDQAGRMAKARHFGRRRWTGESPASGTGGMGQHNPIFIAQVRGRCVIAAKSP